MSSLRTLLCGVLAAITITVGMAAQEPLETVGPLEQQASPITPENPVPRRTAVVAAVYPTEARKLNATAIVTFVATLDAQGRVAEVRKAGAGFEGLNNPLVMVAPGTPPDPAALRAAGVSFVNAAATALRQWRYEPPGKAPISFPVTFQFTTTGEPTASQDVSGRLPNAPARSTASATPAPPPITNAVRVGGNVLPPTRTKNVQPVYPAIAQSARVQGVVILEAIIGTDGKVVSATVLRSVPLLDQAAVDAVMQWEYTPTLLNGVAVPVIMTVTVSFAMAPPPPPPPAQ